MIEIVMESTGRVLVVLSFNKKLIYSGADLKIIWYTYITSPCYKLKPTIILTSLDVLGFNKIVI